VATFADAPPASRYPWAARPLWQVGLVAALVAAIASVLIYLAARAAGVPMALTEVFEDHFARMPIQNMAYAALLDGGVSGTVLAWACRHWTRRPRRCFWVLAGAGLLASLALPILSDATTSTKIVLCLSHVVVAAIIVPALAVALPQVTTPRPGRVVTR
jgi:hypothetical protein